MLNTNANRYNWTIELCLILCFFFTFAKIKTPIFDIYYYYFVIIFLIPIFGLYFKAIPKNILVIFTLLFFVGVVNVALGLNEFGQFFKTWFSTLFIYCFYYFIIKFYSFDLDKIFSIYCIGAFWVCVLGFLQIIAFKLGWKAGYDYSWLGLEGTRSFDGLKDGIMGLYPIHSIYGEPAHFGCGIAPASFVALTNLVKNKHFYYSKMQSVSIVVAMILSTSSTAYFALFIGLLLLLFNSKNVIGALLMGGLGIVIFIVLYNNIEKFQARVDGVVELAQDDSSLRVALMASNGSVRILANNTIIAWRNAKDHPLFGTGLGSHALAYYKYSVIPSWHEDYGMNYNDANSLFNRLLSETGFGGIILVLIFLIKYKIKYKNIKNNGEADFILWLINSGSLIIMLTFLLRQGHYFSYALPMFVLMYFYTSKYFSLNLIEDKL